MKMYLTIGITFETPLDANDISGKPMGAMVAELLQPNIEFVLDTLFDAPADERLRIRWRLKGDVDNREIN
jgi:hypothetical protein